MEVACEQDCETIRGGVCGKQGLCLCNPPLKEDYAENILVKCYREVSIALKNLFRTNDIPRGYGSVGKINEKSQKS